MIPIAISSTRSARRIEQYPRRDGRAPDAPLRHPGHRPLERRRGRGQEGRIPRRLAESQRLRRYRPDQGPRPRRAAGYRPNILAYYRGKSSARTVWIMTHMDVVPPGETVPLARQPLQGLGRERPGLRPRRRGQPAGHGRFALRRQGPPGRGHRPGLRHRHRPGRRRGDGQRARASTTSSRTTRSSASRTSSSSPTPATRPGR